MRTYYVFLLPVLFCLIFQRGGAGTTLCSLLLCRVVLVELLSSAIVACCISARSFILAVSGFESSQLADVKKGASPNPTLIFEGGGGGFSIGQINLMSVPRVRAFAGKGLHSGVKSSQVLQSKVLQSF